MEKGEKKYKSPYRFIRIYQWPIGMIYVTLLRSVSPSMQPTQKTFCSPVQVFDYNGYICVETVLLFNSTIDTKMVK